MGSTSHLLRLRYYAPTHATTVPTATALLDTFILTFSLGSELYLLTLHKRQVGQGIMDAHPKVFFFFFFFVNAISWHNDNVFACRFKSREKAYAEIGRKCTSSAFSYTFPTMTFMTDENPKQITPAAYMMRLLIRGAKSLVTLTSPCATSTFQSKETANRAYYAL